MNIPGTAAIKQSKQKSVNKSYLTKKMQSVLCNALKKNK